MRNLLFSIFYLSLTSFVYSQIDSIQPKKETTKAEEEYKINMLPYYSFGDGLGITSADSLYQVNIRFRMQNRVTYFDNQDEDDAIDAQIRRLRLRFDGFIGNPKFEYSIQLSFASGDVGAAEEGKNTNIIRDAMIFYKPTNKWSFGFGQTKLPGNRQRLNSSGALQLTDRSINNANFNIDRDFGFQVQHSNKKRDKFSYTLRGAVSSGEGRNWTDFKDTGLAYTGKVELMPFGAFANDGTNFEGDLKRETSPKLMLSGAYSYNNKAHRTQGQLGDEMFDTANIKSLFLDAMLKYQGWALMYAYMNRNSDKIFSYNPEDVTDFRYVYAGHGHDVQASYTFPKNYELIGRFSTQKVKDEIFPFKPNTKQYSLGLTKYIWEHAFKLQAEVTYENQEFFNQTTKDNWYARLQVEIGI